MDTIWYNKDKTQMVNLDKVFCFKYWVNRRTNIPTLELNGREQELLGNDAISCWETLKNVTKK